MAAMHNGKDFEEPSSCVLERKFLKECIHGYSREEEFPSIEEDGFGRAREEAKGQREACVRRR